MQDTLGGNPAVDQHLESPPVHAGLLTAEAQLPPPEADDPSPEGPQGTPVARHRMVVEIPLNDRLEPWPRLGRGLMSAWAELLLDRFQLRHHAPTRRLAADREVARLSVPLADVREAQKVERFRLAFAPLLAVGDGVWPTLDQACLLRLELQPELVQAVSQRRQEPLCLTSGLEAEHTSSRAGELHPRALTDPDVNVSVHPALSVQPPPAGGASARPAPVGGVPPAATIVPPAADAAARVCLSPSPTSPMAGQGAGGSGTGPTCSRRCRRCASRGSWD
jgi:hypothetical protein